MLTCITSCFGCISLIPFLRSLYFCVFLVFLSSIFPMPQTVPSSSSHSFFLKSWTAMSILFAPFSGGFGRTMKHTGVNHLENLKICFRFLLIISTFTLLFINVKQFYDSYLSVPVHTHKHSSDKDRLKGKERFRLDWNRERSLRTDWWSIWKPCFGNTDWKQVKNGWEKSERSNATTSIIIYQDTRPAREYSRLFIQSKTTDGRNKTFGGDTWRVYLRGPASIAASIFDHNNGTYEALFLIMEPGVYRLEIYLDYSLCDGFRDPPIDWFIIGNAHGKFQKKGVLGTLDEFLYQAMPGNHTISIQSPLLNTAIQSLVGPSPPQCKESCLLLYDGYGRWINSNTWKPFLEEAQYKTIKASVTQPSGTIVSYGDSLGLRFGNSMNGNPNVRKVYQSSTYRYNWIYPVGDEQEQKKRNDDLDFDLYKVISYIKDTLDAPSINTQQSTLVINMGLHYLYSLNFTVYHSLIEHFLDLILVNQTLEVPGVPRYKTNIIWKTTTQIKKEKASNLQDTASRFMTTQRVILFNAYATWRMCRAGIPVLDVFQPTMSYPPGPLDVVHYPNFVFKMAEDSLANFKRFHNNNNNNNNNNNHISRTCVS